jgi:hypothetical protein
VIVDRLHRTLRGRNALLNIFELWVGCAGILSGIVFFYNPAAIEKNALAIALGHHLVALWNVAYFAAGGIIWYGLLRPSPKWEIFGLYILGSTTAINGLAISSVFGLRGSPSAFLLFGLALASWLRASFVMRSALRLAEEFGAAAR